MLPNSPHTPGPANPYPHASKPMSGYVYVHYSNRHTLVSRLTRTPSSGTLTPTSHDSTCPRASSRARPRRCDCAHSTAARHPTSRRVLTMHSNDGGWQGGGSLPYPWLNISRRWRSSGVTGIISWYVHIVMTHDIKFEEGLGSAALRIPPHM
jgi:hypothetical protein